MLWPRSAIFPREPDSSPRRRPKEPTEVPCPAVSSLFLVLALALACALAAPAGAESGGAGPASSGHTAASGTRDQALKRGSRGPLVVQLQQKLGIPADGVFGPQTGHAVRRFQARKRLTVDGIVGSQTARVLGLQLAEGTRPAADAPRSVSHLHSRGSRSASRAADPRAVSADGTYRGKYQFDRQTWRAMGGHGDPARASEAEQDRRALALYRDARRLALAGAAAIEPSPTSCYVGVACGLRRRLSPRPLRRAVRRAGSTRRLRAARSRRAAKGRTAQS